MSTVVNVGKSTAFEGSKFYSVIVRRGMDICQQSLDPSRCHYAYGWICPVLLFVGKITLWVLRNMVFIFIENYI